MAENTYLIIGGGLAGASAARTLREEAFDGRVVILAAEDEVPYIRPPLSKEYLAGKAERSDALVEGEDWYREHDVELLRDRRAVALDVAAHEVVLDGGERLSYAKLLLATGASPRRLPAAHFGELDGVHYLRTVRDSEALREALHDGGRRVVVVGAGWIGLEVAAAARGYGNEVTVLGREGVPLEPVLGPELGAYFGEVHRRNGVTLRMGVDVAGFTGRGTITGVVLGGGEVVPADVVVVGIGAVPNTELARAVGLTVDNGIVVDASLRAGNDVWAAGDVARAFHPVLGKHLRVEHWANADRQGPAAARSMLGQHISFDRVPYFYTDQFDLGMEFSGYGDLMDDTRVVYRGDRESGEFIAFWLAGDRVVAGMNVNVWDVNAGVEKLIATGAPVDEARLVDGTIALDEVQARQ
ncbi:MAG: FAD-dependent oxidoreductase [Actinomycetales bacterium]|nr:FAD-dependent oxidoreductase [Actinomycetales bacterium]